MGSLLAMLFLQGAALRLTSSVDRPRVGVGEEIVFTLRAVGHSTAPFRVDVPSLDGFALVDRRERTDVVAGTQQTTREFTLELRLRAEQVGTWRIGPIRVEHADASAFSVVESVTVTSAASVPSGLEPDLLALIPRVPAPQVGEPSVFTVVSDQRVFVGDQVNLLTGAWLPRSLRLRLRQAPTLSPPSLAGVWATPRLSVAGAVASREFNGETYDLFVGYQTVYPLNSGTITIPPARLTWMQPSNRQFLSEERGDTAESSQMTLAVRPLPDVGRPPAVDGPIARDLRIEYRLGGGAARAGAVLPVEVVVSGAGNLPLWPAPRIAWPAGIREYEEGTEGASHLTGLRLGGSKRFRFSVVPDSAGSLPLPPLEYPYFDPGTASYRTARAAGIVVPVLEAAPVTERRSPIPLEEPEAPSPAERLVGLPPLVLALLLIAPLLAVAGFAVRRRGVRRRRPPAPLPAPAEQLETLVKSLILPGTPAAPRALVGALRAAGVERDGAERLAHLHLALETERFGGAGRGGAPPALEREIDAALKDLPRPIRRGAGSVALWIGAMLSLSAGASTALAQTGIDLYSRGEYGPAARAFHAEATRTPGSGALWYDLAASEYLAQRDAQAVAALLAARARAPLDPRVKALWTALSRQHEQLRRAGPAWPLRAEECLAISILGLWLGAGLSILLRRQRLIWGTAFALAGGFAIVGAVLRTEREQPRAVLMGGASLRISPHGLAPERGAVPGFSVVRLASHRGRWWLIRTSDGSEGWVPEEILARSPALD